jgi:hypothetical protein
MQTKDEVLEAYKSFEAWALMQQHCKGMKALCSDQGGEYLSKSLISTSQQPELHADLPLMTHCS